MKNTQRESDPEQPPPARRKFGWFGLRDKLRILKQMYIYHSPWDAELAMRSMLWRGMRIGKKQRTPSEPYCDLHNDPEFDMPLVCIAPGIFVCQLCRTLTSVPIPKASPTIKLVPDVERTTGPIIKERPALAYRRQLHPDAEAGEDTQHLRAIRKRNTINLALEEVPTQELKKYKGE